jgi:hypothetical protein
VYKYVDDRAEMGFLQLHEKPIFWRTAVRDVGSRGGLGCGSGGVG